MVTDISTAETPIYIKYEEINIKKYFKAYANLQNVYKVSEIHCYLYLITEEGKKITRFMSKKSLDQGPERIAFLFSLGPLLFSRESHF